VINRLQDALRLLDIGPVCRYLFPEGEFYMPSMAELELTPTQRSVLNSLIGLSEREDGPVKATAIASNVDRSPGTIRNTMQGLKSLQLVEGIPGPEGGYQPTARAYNIQEKQQSADDNSGTVPLHRAGQPLSECSASELVFPTIDQPDQCCVDVKLDGTMPELERGTMLTIGPVPATGLIVKGSVLGVDETQRRVICEINALRVSDSPE
jgi:predicted transcriptional regulator